MMKNRRLHTIILPLCTLLLFSCTQDTISPASDSENEIRFQTGTTTRGLIDNLAVGSEICLYGYHGENPLAKGSYLADGTSKALEGKTLAYRNFNGSNRWSVVNGDNPITYFWEGDGKYRFFGWLAKDATDPTTPLSVPAGWTYEESTKSLTIPATILNKDYNQFDFLYSNVHERTMPTQSKSDPVALEMNHLFTAFGIGIRNTSKDDVTIKRLTLRTLHDKGSAVINFSTTPCTVTYGTTSISRNPNTDPFYALTGNYSIRKQNGVLYDIFAPTATAKKYYLMWPQAESVFPELKFANDEEETKANDTDFPIILEYESNGKTFKKRLKFPKQAWEAGKLNYFDILIADKIVQMNVTVLDWDYTTSDVDFKESVSIKENGHLQYDDTNNKCTIDKVNKIVYVENGQPVEATFCLDTPQGGQWEVSLEGDVNEFHIIDDAAPTNDGIGPIDGKTHRIKIVPNIASPTRDYKVRLKFIAKSADGQKTFNADDVIQDDPTDGDEHDADIYTIVLRKA